MSEEGITGSSGTGENHVLQCGMLKELEGHRTLQIVLKTAGRLKLNPIIIENKS